MKRALVDKRPDGWTAGSATRVLRGHGFQVRRVSETVLFAVKHRTAPLGFLIFHVSFFLLFIGGGLIYYTRFVGVTTLVEGQEYEGGFPVHLGASVRLRRAGGSVSMNTRVNHPATWGPATLLIRKAGLAPGLWLQDKDGFSIDRLLVAAKTMGNEPTTIPAGDGDLSVTIEPLPEGSDFPSRADLSETAIRLQVTEGEREVFRGALLPGEVASWDGGRLVLEEIRYWAGFQVVEERGGAVLIFGFVLAVVGLTWRLLWYRRTVAVVWDDQEVRLVGKGEYYRGHFKKELEGIFDSLLEETVAPENAEDN
jgi:cytochrome c biogenesis protein ResB